MTRIPDRCDGTPGNPGTISWSDDSYAYYSYTCTGCRDCEPPRGESMQLADEPPGPFNGPWDQLPKGAT